MLRHALLFAATTLLLTACATAPQTRSGYLSTYDGLKPRTDVVRAKVSEKREDAAVQAVRRVALEPSVIAPGADLGWMTAEERDLLLNQMDARMCFALSRRFEVAAEPSSADAKVRAAVTLVRPTGRAGSALSAAAGFFIPGPIGVRTPVGLGALGAEAEMVDAASGRQLAAVTWSRQANPVGTDTPSLSRIGDALQYTGAFAGAAARAFAPPGAPRRKIEANADPCARFGPRFRPEGFAAKFATGLYMPELSGARDEDEEGLEPEAAPPAASSAPAPN
ncbi:DUF3313 domain-containing protein [Phenylobacterium deserti]|uniref:DUF3313 domain-containing protein n=1 Tax=Phenylobacterium deserti TaxID=1914756 RepID=A0A328ANC5_9CAUL|nr:DUF3313 domain-containing protein [Phenylobacterium deserti]RAK56503.1 DUF3313 domain-containing protein [Phenylobacterium deserti]